MAGKRSAWTPFPYTDPAFDYAGSALKKAWPDLHAGDQEPFPDRARAATLVAACAPDEDPETLANALQQAWRDFHAGRFQAAFETGVALGAAGVSVAVKAIGIHTTHLVSDSRQRLERYRQAVKLAATALDALPDEANSHYRSAYALGRYSQEAGVVEALKGGLAGKIRRALERALELAPKHAEAHTALALYHAEVIAKMGSLIGGMTYGAKAAEAEKHITAALGLTPKAPIVHLEHANLLLLLEGEKGEDAAAAAYERAAKCHPRDAMEALDAAWAAEQIE